MGRGALSYQVFMYLFSQLTTLPTYGSNPPAAPRRPK